MTTTLLPTVRSGLATILEGAGTDATVYRRRQTNYQYPAFVVGWPSSIDLRAGMGGLRRFVISVAVAVEVLDDDSADEQLETLLEAAIAAILADVVYDIESVTDFEEVSTADGRTVLWCRLPVAVLA